MRLAIKTLFTVFFIALAVNANAQSDPLMNRDAHMIVDLEYNIKELSKNTDIPPSQKAAKITMLEAKLTELTNGANKRYEKKTEEWNTVLTRTRDQYKKTHGY